MTEQRRAPRIVTSTRATVVANKKRVPFTIDSLSISGARLIGALALQRGQLIDIILELEAGPVEVAAEVVRVDSPDLMRDQIAVCFVSPSPEARAALREFVRQRLENAEAAYEEEPDA